MSMSATSVEQVLTFLLEAGYRKLDMPLTAASVPFDFTAAFVGTERSSDLVVVLDTVDERQEFAMQRKIEGLSRAMDVAGSRRPLTAILVGPRPRMKTLDLIGRVCRVLFVGGSVGTGENSVRDALAILLPLKLPLPEETTTNPIEALSASVPADTEKGVFEALLAATEKSAGEVEHVLRDLLEEPFKQESGTVDNQ